MDLAEHIYKTTGTFPRDERFGLMSQLRKCAVSVPSNIAEGHGRLTVAEWRHFLGQARGSVLEMQTQLVLAKRLRFAEAATLDNDLELSEEVGRIINGLLTSIRREASRECGS